MKNFNLLQAVKDENIQEIRTYFALISQKEDGLSQIKTEINREEDDLSPWMWACRLSNVELAELLIDYGADINFVDADGRSPLSEALLFEQNEKLIHLLISKNVDVKKANDARLVNGQDNLFAIAEVGENTELSLKIISQVKKAGLQAWPQSELEEKKIFKEAFREARKSLFFQADPPSDEEAEPVCANNLTP